MNKNEEQSIRTGYWGCLGGCLTVAILLALTISSLMGCSNVTPVIKASHRSDPFISDDSLDAVCGGLKKRGQLSVSVNWCKNVRQSGFAEFEIEYELLK